MTAMHPELCVSRPQSASRPLRQPRDGCESKWAAIFCYLLAQWDIICWEWHVCCWNVCLSLYIAVCPSCSALSNWFFLSVLLSFFFFLIHRHIWMGVCGVGSLSPFSLLTLFVPLFFKSQPFLFPCVGSMRDKTLRFVRKSLLYVLNATDLTLLNTLRARNRTYGALGNATCEHRRTHTQTGPGEKKNLLRGGQSKDGARLHWASEKSGILG